VAFGLGLQRMVEPMLKSLSTRMLEVCEDVDCIVASGLACFGAVHVAERLGIPCLPAFLQPITATRSFRNPFVPSFGNRSEFWNSQSHRAFHAGSKVLFRTAVNEMRASVLGLRKMDRPYADPSMGGAGPVLYGYSPSVLPKPREWGADKLVSGYWFLPAGAAWQPPAELQEFLDSGPPPVCIGFGSMQDAEPEKLTELVVTALRRVNRRGLLLTGWGAMHDVNTPGDVYRTQAVPHDWLFPRTCAVVHHGGAGTMAAALRAGVPSIVVPYFGDQPFWGEVVHRLGASPRPVPRKSLTVDSLAHAIRQACESSTLRARTAEVSAQIQDEDGVRAAVAIINTFRHNFRT